MRLHPVARNCPSNENLTQQTTLLSTRWAASAAIQASTQSHSSPTSHVPACAPDSRPTVSSPSDSTTRTSLNLPSSALVERYRGPSRIASSEGFSVEGWKLGVQRRMELMFAWGASRTMGRLRRMCRQFFHQSSKEHMNQTTYDSASSRQRPSSNSGNLFPSLCLDHLLLFPSLARGPDRQQKANRQVV